MIKYTQTKESYLAAKLRIKFLTKRNVILKKLKKQLMSQYNASRKQPDLYQLRDILVNLDNVRNELNALISLTALMKKQRKLDVK